MCVTPHPAPYLPLSSQSHWHLSKPRAFLSYEASHSSLPDFLDFQDVHGFLIADRGGMFNQEAELINQVERWCDLGKLGR